MARLLLHSLLHSLLLLFIFDFQETLAAATDCKVTPNSTNWPTISQWTALNSSVSGRLVTPIPPGIVCQSNSTQFNSAACSALQANWVTSAYHLTTPATVDHNDDSCIPGAQYPCSSAGYPAYVIAATSVADIQAGVKFAAQTGVRLIIKGTGHDYLGR